MFRFIQRLRKDKKGAALVEYFLIVAGVALMGAAAVSTFGHKTSDLVALSAAVLPGAHADDNGPIVSGRIIETTSAEDGNIALDLEAIVDATATARLGSNSGLDVDQLALLVVEP
jgi:Flp pilus assembly pilin Flp